MHSSAHPLHSRFQYVEGAMRFLSRLPFAVRVLLATTVAIAATLALLHDGAIALLVRCMGCAADGSRGYAGTLGAAGPIPGATSDGSGNNVASGGATGTNGPDYGRMAVNAIGHKLEDKAEKVVETAPGGIPAAVDRVKNVVKVITDFGQPYFKSVGSTIRDIMTTHQITPEQQARGGTDLDDVGEAYTPDKL